MIDHKLLTKYETREECNRIASEIKPILEKELHIFGSMIIGEYVLQAKLNLAKEIFEEIEKVTASVYNDFMFNRQYVGINETTVMIFSDELDIAIDELRKKYTEGENK